jgi:hypothetical protein
VFVHLGLTQGGNFIKVVDIRGVQLNRSGIHNIAGPNRKGKDNGRNLSHVGFSCFPTTKLNGTTEAQRNLCPVEHLVKAEKRASLWHVGFFG